MHYITAFDLHMLGKEYGIQFDLMADYHDELVRVYKLLNEIIEFDMWLHNTKKAFLVEIFNIHSNYQTFKLNDQGYYHSNTEGFVSTTIYEYYVWKYTRTFEHSIGYVNDDNQILIGYDIKDDNTYTNIFI